MWLFSINRFLRRRDSSTQTGNTKRIGNCRLQMSTWYSGRIGRFFHSKFFFHNISSQLKTGKMGTHMAADTFPVQYSPAQIFDNEGN